MEGLFRKLASQLSEIIRKVLYHFINEQDALLHSDILKVCFKGDEKRYLQGVYETTMTLENIVGSIDGTVNGIASSIGQDVSPRTVYNGHKRKHLLML